jgi:hypothetical protein
MDTGTPSAAYLHGRINILTHQLRSRMVNIIRLTKPPKHHTITNTATEQLSMEVESTALIRAAEEVMVLTRELKDLWLFGGLDTLHSQEKSAADTAMEDDAKVVYEFMSKMVNNRGESRTEKVTSPAVADVMEVETGTV